MLDDADDENMDDEEYEDALNDEVDIKDKIHLSIPNLKLQSKKES